MSFEVKSVEYAIINGPGRDALFDSMKYNYDDESRVVVEFDIIKGYTMPKDNPASAAAMLDAKDVEIHTIQHEDGTGYNFNLEGYIDIKDPQGYYVPRKFQAFYSARTRKGHIKIMKI